MAIPLETQLREIAANSMDRFAFWASFINRHEIREFAEVGVFKGIFAEYVLRNCPSIDRYFMIDPWRHLENWNKPANVSDADFNRIFSLAMQRTAFAADRRIVIQKTSKECAADLDWGQFDAVYIDGDHTLRGITIDLTIFYDKVKSDGFILGDDFSPSIWQHSSLYEPTLIFPWATYFAEAKNDVIYGLPFNQFLIAKNGEEGSFHFHDLTKKYGETALRSQLLIGPERE